MVGGIDMATENEKAILEAIEFEADDINLDNLEQSLEDMLQGKKEDLDFLKEEREHINNPDHLGETIMDVVCEQFMTQVVAAVGEDFIKENGGLTLDLRSEAHIQTTENFAEGKIATHNTKIDYQQRYDDWQGNFQKDPNIEHKNSNYRYNEDQKVWEKHDKRSDSWKTVLNKDARSDFDKGRPTGNNTANTNMDHTVSAGEIIRDPAANAHMTREEQVAFANSEKNLNLMDSAANQSKGDSTMSEFLDSERDGKKAADRFDIDEEALRKKDAEAREEYNKQKQEAEERSIAAGKQSQKEEFYKIGKAAVKTAFISMLTALVKEIISKLVLWLKSAEKSLKTLIEHVKIALEAFISKLKGLFVDATGNALTMIATAIIGPVVGIIKKAITLLKQGWKSLKEAIDYLRQHRGEPLSSLMPQVGIIVVTGLCGIGTIVLSEAIETGLESAVPFLAVEIPFLGIKPTSLIGSLMGAIVCGVVGAIAINLINKHVAKQQKSDNLDAQIDKNNEILVVQDKLLDVKEQKLLNTCQEVAQELTEHHREADEQLKGILEKVTDPAISEAQRMNSEALSQLLQSS